MNEKKDSIPQKEDQSETSQSLSGYSTSPDDPTSENSQAFKGFANKRPTFKTKRGDPIRAAGIIPFCRDPDTQEAYFLLCNYEDTGIWEDLGGKTDFPDRDPLDTVTREASEESNACFRLDDDETLEECLTRVEKESETNQDSPIGSRAELITVLDDSARFWRECLRTRRHRAYYIDHSKYLLYLVELEPEWMHLRPSRCAHFGHKEIWEGGEREMVWLPVSEFQKKLRTGKTVNARLNYGPIHKVIRTLVQDWQADIRLNINRGKSTETKVDNPNQPTASKSSEDDEEQTGQSVIIKKVNNQEKDTSLTT